MEALNERIDRQRAFLEQWRKPSEPLLFETLRAIDELFCRELFEGDASASDPARLAELSTMTWGVNKALARMIPDRLATGPFKLFQSVEDLQARADSFLLHCGILERAELLRAWVAEGLVSARFETPSKSMSSEIREIMILDTRHPSLFAEFLSLRHLEWVSERVREFDLPLEQDLANRLARMTPALQSRVRKLGDWGISYDTTEEIDELFAECGQLYLRRMWSQDLIGLDDKIGGHEFRDYLGILAALSGRAQKHLNFAMLLKQRHPELDRRNLLTTFCTYEELVEGLADHLDADTPLIRDLLPCITLTPGNRDVHTLTAETAWAPLVRASQDFCILPLYGLEINPFLFLLRDLQARYPKDWSLAANNRERRWLVDLKAVFPTGRWVVPDRNLKLRDDGRTVTDIDFFAYDRTRNELALFQLKWQQPVGIDNRARRSAGKNLVEEGNRWIASVCAWLNKYGAAELSRRAGIDSKPELRVTFFVIARYNAFYSGYSGQDERAVWADWGHLLKARMENPAVSLIELAALLKQDTNAGASMYPGDSYFVPIQDLMILMNPQRIGDRQR